MTPQEIILGLGVVGTLIASVAALYRTRGENRNKGQEVKTAIDKQIDERAKAELERVYAQVDDLNKRVTALESDRDDAQDAEKAAVKTAERIRSVVRAWFTQLKTWDQNGRLGPMPIPPDADMHLIDLDYPTPKE